MEKDGIFHQCHLNKESAYYLQTGSFWNYRSVYFCVIVFSVFMHDNKADTSLCFKNGV